MNNNNKNNDDDDQPVHAQLHGQQEEEHQQQFMFENLSASTNHSNNIEHHYNVPMPSRMLRGNKELVSKLELVEMKMEIKEKVHEMSEKWNEKMDKIRDDISTVKDSINVLEKEQLKNANSGNGTSSAIAQQQQLDIAELDQRIQQLIGHQMAPWQQEMADLRNKETALENELKQKDQQIEALVEGASKEKAKMEMLQQKVNLLSNLREEHLKGNVHIVGNGICVPQNEWYQWNPVSIQVSGRTAKHFNGSFGYTTVRAKNPFASEIPNNNNIHGQMCAMRQINYFEVKIVNNTKGNWIFIGLCDSNFPLKGIWVGGNARLFGVCGNDTIGWIYMEGKQERNVCKFGQGHVIGCGVELARNGRQMFFTKDGKILVQPFPLPLNTSNVGLFPAVTMLYRCEVQANFGHEPFKYDLAKHT